MDLEKTLRRQRNFRTALRLIPTILAMIISIIGLIVPHLFDASEHHQGALAVLIILGAMQIITLIASEKQSQQPDPSPMKASEFVRLYSEALAKLLKIIPLIQDVDENGKRVFDENARKDAIVQTLQNICTIAEAYKGNGEQHACYMNACWYEPILNRQVTTAQMSLARPFMDPGRNLYKTFLVLKDWAYHGEKVAPRTLRYNKRPKACVPEGLVLPVDDDTHYTMFGAPLAFMTAEIQYVNNIKSLLSNDTDLAELPGLHDESIRQEVKAHFTKRRSYESFVDLPVEWGDTVLGVVALQSRLKVIFDEHNRDDGIMLDSIQPFLDILAMIVLY